MTRREYLEMIVKAGLVYSVPFATFLSCEPREEISKPLFFNEQEFGFMSVLTETIIPKTDTIGAIEAGVPHFIDIYMKYCADEVSQKEYLKNLNTYQTHLSDLKIGIEKPSAELTNQWTKDEKSLDDKGVLDFMKRTKTMTLKGYFNDQKAIEQNLYYLPVPKEYKACVEVAEVGKMWIN
jgi:hypothetical protein